MEIGRQTQSRIADAHEHYYAQHRQSGAQESGLETKKEFGLYKKTRGNAESSA